MFWNGPSCGPSTGFKRDGIDNIGDDDVALEDPESIEYRHMRKRHILGALRRGLYAHGWWRPSVSASSPG